MVCINHHQLYNTVIVPTYTTKDHSKYPPNYCQSNTCFINHKYYIMQLSTKDINAIVKAKL